MTSLHQRYGHAGVAESLTPAQRAILRACAADGHGTAVCPGGYPTAGRDAARWWRSAKILERLGLVRRVGHQAVKLTEKGEELQL